MHNQTKFGLKNRNFPVAIGIHHPGGAVTFSCEVIPGAQWGQNRFQVGL